MEDADRRRGYANWTGEAWNLHVHAWAYKQALSPANVSLVADAVLDRAADVFVPGLTMSELTPAERTNARNMTSALLAVPQSGKQLEFRLTVAPPHAANWSAWTARIVWPRATDARGEADGWAPLPRAPPDEPQSPWLPDGAQTAAIVRLDVQTYTNGSATDTAAVAATGNSSAWLVPPEGVVVLSDIDDILRLTKIYQPDEGLRNSIARDYQPWDAMPRVYAAWRAQQPTQPYHFHYLTTTPQQAARRYLAFILAYYPPGSFDARPLNFTTVDQTFSIRRLLLDRILQTFPRRRFVLVGDTTNPDVMADYPAVARAYSNVACILLRNTSATDANDRFPYDTSAFNGLNPASYMFFRRSDDLLGLDLGNGDCRNASVSQTVTFGWQGLPFGLTTGSGGGGSSSSGGSSIRAMWARDRGLVAAVALGSIAVWSWCWT